MTIKRALIFRPQSAPSPQIPLGARSVGANHVGADYLQSLDGRPMLQVFWFCDGEGEVRIHDRTYLIRGSAIVVYASNSPHYLQSKSSSWSWRYWTMDGPLADNTATGFGLREGIYPAGPAPHDLFEELADAVKDISAIGERYASALAYRLLSMAAFPQKEATPGAVQKAALYLDTHYQTTTLSIQKVVDHTGIHRSVLTRLFSTAKGISPVQYLTSRRIQHAQALLKHSQHSIQAIARHSGFEDPSYFTRVFRQRCGMTPQQFRNQ